MGASVGKAASGGRRRGRRRGGRAAAMSEINITPMVDVMLVLLIIFMVAAPLSVVGVPVKLPETSAPPVPNEQEEPLTVTLNVEGQIFIMDTEIAANELLPKLRAIVAERANDKIFIRADGDVPYERFAQIMGALNRGGFSDFGLIMSEGGPSFDGEAASNPSDE